MYHAPEWYTQLRDVGLLWQSLGGVMMFWTALPKRNHSKINCGIFWVLGALGLYVCRRNGLLFLNAGTNVYIVYFLCIAMVFACCDVSGWTAWMIGASGYLAQHICGNLELAIRTIPRVDQAFEYSNWIVVLDIVCYSIVYGLIRRIFRNNSFREDEETSTLQKIMFSLLALLFSFGFYAINQYIRDWGQLTWSELLINSLYATIGGIFLLVMQYGLIRQQRLSADHHVMQTLLHTQAEQWQSSLEHTQLVNEKYHDLKKLLGSFRSKTDSNYLEALSDAIDAYDDSISSGHQVADVILTEGREICRKNGIQLTCYVNGADLAVLEDMDLYFLLKNALDNAIEAVRDLPAGQARFISMTACREGQFVMLHTENPCSEVFFEDSLPITKKDPSYHGFGMKSMARVAAKYGGTLACSVENNVFYLDVLLLP